MVLRQPLDILNLTIASEREVPTIGGQFDDIIDCTTEGSQHRYRDRVLHVPPSGSNSHKWAADDLDAIVELAEGCLEKGRNVLIHCGRGVSRSTCAAAAVLLHLGHARTVEDAVALTRHPDRQPVKTAVASLRTWWDARRQMELF